MGIEFNTEEGVNKYAEGSVPEESSLKPINLEIIGEVNNKKILDLGCGDGNYSILFAKNGAKVIAVDLSEKQIELAKKTNSHENITYLVSNGTNLIEIENNSIDLIFMNLVVHSIDNKETLEGIISEIKRILKNDGRFIFTILHPTYFLSSYSLDKPLDFKYENYFNDGSKYTAEAITKKGNKMIFNDTYFSLTYLSKILHENKFKISKLVESKQIPEEELYLPLFLAIECIN